MAKTDGEYELVLGNRQLLSAFFIVVILFALFFTMGYIVGRNSAPTNSMATAAPPASSVRPSTTSAAPPATETATETPKPAETAADDDKPAPTTRPVTAAPETVAPRETVAP